MSSSGWLLDGQQPATSNQPAARSPLSNNYQSLSFTFDVKMASEAQQAKGDGLDFKHDLGPLNSELLELQQMLSGNISPSNFGLFAKEETLSNKMAQAWQSVRQQESMDIANMILQANMSELQPDPTLPAGKQVCAGSTMPVPATYTIPSPTEGKTCALDNMPSAHRPLTATLSNSTTGSHCSTASESIDSQAALEVYTSTTAGGNSGEDTNLTNNHTPLGGGNSERPHAPRTAPVSLAKQPNSSSKDASETSSGPNPKQAPHMNSSDSGANSSQRTANDTGKVVTLTVQADIEAMPPKDALLDTPPARTNDPNSQSVPSVQESTGTSDLLNSTVSKAANNSRKNTSATTQKIVPRSTQYEKHALLQNKSESGLSELEMFLKEKEDSIRQKKDRMLKKHKSLSIEEHRARSEFESDRSRRRSADSGGSGGSTSKMKLMPRSSQYEPHPLLEKTESGLSELESYLQEIEQEAIRRKSLKDEQLSRDTSKKNFTRVGTGSLRLQPRIMQYEKNPLLQKDQDGLLELDKLLAEKEYLKSTQNEADTKDEDDNTMEKDTLPLMNQADTKNKLKSSLKRVHFDNKSEGPEGTESVQLEGDELTGGDAESEPLQGVKSLDAPNTSPQQKCCIIL